jgi:hypothetical protein
MRAWLFTFMLLSTAALAHVGSPDVFFEGEAGPYHLLVTVRPPAMIPGVADVEVRETSGTVNAIRVTPIYITGKDAGFPPTPDLMAPVPGDPKSYTGKVWLMASGSWEVRVDVEGGSGSGRIGVPVAAFARRTLPMQKALGALLFGLMLVLAVGIISIAGAAAREGQLEPGTQPPGRNFRKARIAMLVATFMVLALLYLGNSWWNSEASTLKHDMLYKAPPLTATLQKGLQLTLQPGRSDWHDLRKSSWSMQLVPDHGHLMHLFLLRVPAMDRFYHLHPDQTPNGTFAMNLPAIASGHYKIFADVVRASGFPDTMVSEIDLPEVAGKPISGDDSDASASPTTRIDEPVANLPDGTRMVWEREGASAVGRLSWFRFKVEDGSGKPVTDLEPYMGMAGHAVFIRSDESVFAHIHPAGSAPMAALAITAKDDRDGTAMAGMNHSQRLPGEVSFPYGFPQAGDYRMFVQIKRAGRVETGVFDTHVAN